MNKNVWINYFIFIAVFFVGCQSLSKGKLVSTVKQQALISTLPIIETNERIDGAKGNIVYAQRPVLSWNCLQGLDITAYELVVSKEKDFSGFDIQQDIPVSNQCVFTVEAELEDKVVYYWRVRAKTDNENGPWSDTRQFSVDFSFIPAPPKLKNPPPGAQNYPLQFTFEWFSEPRATEHHIEVSEGDPSFSGANTVVISASISGTLFVSNVKLKPGKVYFWRVRSLRGGVPGSFGEIRKFTTIGDTLPPQIKVISETDIVAQQIPASFEMKFTALDQGMPAVGTQKVEVYLNDKSISVTKISATDDTYSCMINGLTEGLNRVTVIAYDRIGNKTQISVDVKVTFGKRQQKQGWMKNLLGGVKQNK